jgi:hypothetical protein
MGARYYSGAAFQEDNPPDAMLHVLYIHLSKSV